MAKRTFKVVDGKPVEQKTATPVETPVAPTATATPAEKPAKVDALSPEAMSYRHQVWATLTGAKLAAVRAATSLAVIWAKFSEKEMPLSLEVFKTFMDEAVNAAGAPKVAKTPQFSQEAWYLVRNISDEETLSHLRGGVFNGCTNVPLDMVLLALYLRNQSQDEKQGQLDTDADGNVVIAVCGCGVCNGRKFVRETWLTGNGNRVGNYVDGRVLGSSEKLVPVSRKCQGKINSVVYKDNEPIKALNAEIADRRANKERTEPFHPMKPMIYGVSSQEANRIAAGEQRRQERRQQSDNRLAEIVGGIHAPTRTGVGRGGASAYPQTRRHERADGRQSGRF